MTDNNANWKKARIKDVSTPYTGNSIKDEHKDLYIDNINAIPYISTKDINDKFQTIDFDNGLFIKNSDKSFRRAPKNSTLLCIEGGNAGKKIAFNDRTVCFVNKLCCFHSKTENNKFLYYFLMSPSFTEEFKSRITGLIGGVSVSALRNIHIRLPALDEQEKIANFLDEKCTEIDKFSEDIQKQIDILNNYKKSVITRAVTKGLDPNAEMKDSGIKWIGDIPKNWTSKKVKYYLFRDEKRNPGEMPILSVYREYGVIPKNSRDDNHNVTSEDTSKYKYVRPGYLVINKMKAWQGSMGVSDYEGVVSPAYFIYRLKSKDILPEYIHHLLRSCYKDEFRRISGGIREGQWDLPAIGFENTPICIPSIDEQKSILNFIDSIVPQIEESVSVKAEQILRLLEYKKSIIYEYVTGKKRVKGAL